MTLLAIALTVILLAIAAIHTLWALSIWWPARDEDRLVAAVVGFRGAKRMPGPIPCALVALTTAGAALVLWLPAHMLRSVIMGLIGAVFLVRGVLSFRPFWRRMTPQEPFATYDRRYYGPLCLALSAAFFVLLLGGF